MKHKPDYTKCNKPEKHILQGGICLVQSMFSNKCSIDNEICIACKN